MPLALVWWQRILVSALALVLSFALPVALGIRGIAMIFAVPLCSFPAIMVAESLILKAIPPEYANKWELVTTLFPRRN